MNSGSKRVAIIGSGVSGVISGKYMLDAGFTPTLFEASSQIGGLWNPELSRCWGSLKTNLSKYTCCISNHAWDSQAEIFPSQENIFQYLQSYANRFIQPDAFRLNCRVIKVIPKCNDKIELEFIDEQKCIRNEEFDKLIIATGFFSNPKIPTFKSSNTFLGSCIHSSQYLSPNRYIQKRVAIIGSSFSASEVAAEIAQKADRVINIFSRPSWIIPRYIPLDPNSPATPFMPVDLALYRRKVELDDASKMEPPGESPENRYLKFNRYFQSLFGNTKQEVMRQFRRAGDESLPPFVSISDSFADLVRSGKIELVQGRFEGFSDSSLLVKSIEGDLPKSNMQDTPYFELENIDDVIFCTGYKPSFDFLPPDMLSAMEYDPDDDFCPLLLYKDMLHPTAPGIAFVGMYRGPYFGVMELQARLVAAFFSGDRPMPNEADLIQGINFSRKIREKQPRPQFPHGDYVGLMDSLAMELGCFPAAKYLRKGVVVIPQHYFPGLDSEQIISQLDSDVLEVQNIIQLVQHDVTAFENGKQIAAKIFQELAGNWRFERKLNSRLESAPSGIVTGLITFAESAESPETEHVENELLYVEEGTFETEKGFLFDVSSKYTFFYNYGADSLDIYFPPGKYSGTPCSKTRGGLFLCLKFNPSPHGWVAVGEHLCGDDLYKATYCFAFDGLCLKQITIAFHVVGPTKDYDSETILKREFHLP